MSLQCRDRLHDQSGARYARMFPELPSFQADEQFLHALATPGKNDGLGNSQVGKLHTLGGPTDRGSPLAKRDVLIRF